MTHDSLCPITYGFDESKRKKPKRVVMIPCQCDLIQRVRTQEDAYRRSWGRHEREMGLIEGEQRGKDQMIEKVMSALGYQKTPTIREAP